MIPRLVTVGVVALAVHLAAMGLYLRNGLQGDIGFHILPAEMFGVPAPLAKRGIRPLYTDDVNSGWDGQFYFYIANDPLGSEETVRHIDSPAYRYQRLGLSIFAKLVSLATLQDWVSPTLYYLTYLGLVIAGTVAAAWLLRAAGLHPAWALLWSLSAGTQLTPLNGLPDAAADAFFLLGIAFFLVRPPWALALAAPAFAFSALSREVYVAFPLFMILFSMLDRVSTAPPRGRIRSVARWFLSAEFACLVIPVALFSAVQIAIRVRLGMDPVAQSSGVLGPPLAAWWEHWSSGIFGHHVFLGSGSAARNEVGLLSIFLLLLIVSFTVGARTFIVAIRRRERVDQALAAMTMAFSVLYLFFGPVVMKYYTGYMKAVSVFLFLVPYLHARRAQLLAGEGRATHRAADRVAARPLWRRAVAEPGRLALFTFLIVAAGFGGYYVWKERVLLKAKPLYLQYTRITLPHAKEDATCLDAYRARLTLVGERAFPVPETNFNKLFPPRNAKLLRVEVTNLTDRDFPATTGRGGVNISYHWLGIDGTTVLGDGIRTFVPGGIAAGATAQAEVVVEYPRHPGRYRLKLSPVQEGCAWFYLVDPSSAIDLQVEVK